MNTRGRIVRWCARSPWYLRTFRVGSRKADGYGPSAHRAAHPLASSRTFAPTTSIAPPGAVRNLSPLPFRTIWRLRGETGVEALGSLVQRSNQWVIVITYGAETLLEEVFPTESEAVERALHMEATLLERGWEAI